MLFENIESRSDIVKSFISRFKHIRDTWNMKFMFETVDSKFEIGQNKWFRHNGETLYAPRLETLNSKIYKSIIDDQKPI